MSARLKWVIAGLIAVTIGLKLMLQGDTASPPKVAQLEQLRDRLGTVGYETAGIIGDDIRPTMMSAKGACVLMVSVMAPDGMTDTTDTSDAGTGDAGTGEKVVYAYHGRFFERAPPRWEPIFSQNFYKLLRSMRIESTFLPVYKIRTAKACDPSADLIVATH